MESEFDKESWKAGYKAAIKDTKQIVNLMERSQIAMDLKTAMYLRNSLDELEDNRLRNPATGFEASQEVTKIVSVSSLRPHTEQDHRE